MRKFLVFAAVLSLLGSGQTLAQNAYVTNDASDTVLVIATASNTVIATIPVGDYSRGVAVTPDGRKVYVTNENSNTVSVIDTATNIVIATIPVGIGPAGVAVSPDGHKVYVANESSAAVSVIMTESDTVTGTITFSRFDNPFAVVFQPPPKFAGTPGKVNCHGKSVSALAKQYGGLSHAAAALGYASVKALQDAISAYCADVPG